jgi:hypothetical protein
MKKEYTAIASYIDTCCKHPHLAAERISANSSREAFLVAQRRFERHNIRSGDVYIIRGESVITGIVKPDDGHKYTDERVVWTAEETQEIRIPFGV